MSLALSGSRENDMEDKSRKIPIYIRVSSDDQVHGTSLQSQLQECRAALKRDGQTPGEVFADEGESAKSIETRPAFLRLLDHIKEYRPPAVMVHKIDRFARNNLEAQIVRSKLTKLGCRLLSATEAISDDPSGKFMFDVLSAVAEYDNRLRSERCRQGMVSQVAQGWWVYSPPLGYNIARTPQNKPTLTPDESRAPLSGSLQARRQWPFSSRDTDPGNSHGFDYAGREEGDQADLIPNFEQSSLCGIHSG